DLLQALSGADAERRATLVDNPAFPVGHALASATPDDACILVLAYAGPAAVDYYNARLDYLLYPRRVRVTADVSDAAPEGCGYLAVFRDPPQNLAAEPFAGNWDEAALAARIEGAERLQAGDAVMLYKLR